MEIKNKNKVYRTAKTSVFSCQYHVIWATKYRRKVLREEIQDRLKELIMEKQKEFDYEILEMGVMNDHVHLLMDLNPLRGVNKVIGEIKGYTSKTLRSEFKELQTKLPCLWTRSKFISTVGSVSLEVVKKYIEDQKNV